MWYYINCFFVYSILGHLIETVTALITKSNFKSGFLYGFWTPVYGFGSIIILILSNYLFKNLHLNRVVETIIVFLVVAIVLSSIEVIGGVLLKQLFGVSYWDYTKEKYNLGKYISLKMTLIWGVMSIVFIYIVNPILEPLIKKVPKFVTVILIILFFFDNVVTFITKKKN